MIRSRMSSCLLRFQTPSRELHSSVALFEKLFDADRVRQYEKMHRVPDKESALKELDNLGKPGGRSVVEFFFGESNAAAIISGVNTIKHPVVGEDELLLFAARTPVSELIVHPPRMRALYFVDRAERRQLQCLLGFLASMVYCRVL
jgi:hypothetical protein